MKLYEEIYFKYEWKLWIFISTASLVLHYFLIFLFRSSVFHEKGELFSTGGKIIAISVSYIVPFILILSGLKASWKIYVKYSEENQYNYCILILLFTAIVVAAFDKFIFGII